MRKPNSCVFSLVEDFVYIQVTLTFRVNSNFSHEGNKSEKLNTTMHHYVVPDSCKSNTVTVCYAKYLHHLIKSEVRGQRFRGHHLQSQHRNIINIT